MAPPKGGGDSAIEQLEPRVNPLHCRREPWGGVKQCVDTVRWTGFRARWKGIDAYQLCMTRCDARKGGFL